LLFDPSAELSRMLLAYLLGDADIRAQLQARAE
jgi:hypothetical protein